MNKLKQLFSKHYSIPGSNRIAHVFRRLSLTEKTIFGAFATLLCVSSLLALWKVNQAFMVEMPAYGGTLTEGVVGIPRFINPILAFSDVDRDLTALTYSGLMKATSDGTLVPDLAQSYSLSSDGRVYIFTLKPGLKFQDGTPLTADDVVFTIEKAEDPAIKSPKRPNWDGVTAEKIDDLHVKLTLKQPYAPFLENTTLGILPKHIWENVSADEFPFEQFNITPIGSGPYRFGAVERNSSGIPLSYTLQSSPEYALGKPLIRTFVIRFYQNTDDLLAAYNNGDIQSMTGISPAQAHGIKQKGGLVERTPLPRIFAVFFNQNHAAVLANKEVRQALDTATDKQAIVDTVLDGEGVVVNGPIPPGLLSDNATTTYRNETETERIAAAKKILETAGWKWNDTKKVYEKKIKKVTVPLAFSISTSDTPELSAAANMLKDMWNAVGAQVDVKISDIGELNQTIIRSRNYDALLFGEIIGRDFDLYAFWHSSQRNDPGLNIAMYTNSKVDTLLTDARTTSDYGARVAKYKAVEQDIENDIPAVFLYAPDFLYVVPKQLMGFSFGHVTTPDERFLDITKWYTKTENIWRIFVPKTAQNNY